MNGATTDFWLIWQVYKRKEGQAHHAPILLNLLPSAAWLDVDMQLIWTHSPQQVSSVLDAIKRKLSFGALHELMLLPPNKRLHYSQDLCYQLSPTSSSSADQTFPEFIIWSCICGNSFSQQSQYSHGNAPYETVFVEMSSVRSDSRKACWR